MNQEDLELLKREAGKTQGTQLQEYLIGFEERQNRSNRISIIAAIIGAISSTVAAITGLILLLQ